MGLIKIPFTSLAIRLSIFHEGQSGFLCGRRLRLNRGGKRGTKELVLDLVFDGKHDDRQLGCTPMNFLADKAETRTVWVTGEMLTERRRKRDGKVDGEKVKGEVTSRQIDVNEARICRCEADRYGLGREDVNKGRRTERGGRQVDGSSEKMCW